MYFISRRFLYERVKETVGRQFAILHPFQSEYKYGRRIRCSPLYSTLSAQGAVFGSIMCFERPLYFDKEYKGNAPDLSSSLFFCTWELPFGVFLREFLIALGIVIELEILYL